MEDHPKLTLAAELSSLAQFREFIKSLCSQAGVDEQSCYDLQIASDEACTNVINHGYAGMNPGSIILELKASPEFIVMTITDFGHPFEPVEAPQPDVEAMMLEKKASGFGLYLIYQTMDRVDYRTTAFGNHLILTKIITAEKTT
jgi:anti-sigma regulatory factor (Ser/Thr protein kinase)